MVFWETKDTAKAISNWQTSIEQDPEYADGYCRLATHYMEAKKYDVAEQYLRSGLRLRPNDPFLNYDMGVFLNYRNFPDSAIGFYRKALALDRSTLLAPGVAPDSDWQANCIVRPFHLCVFNRRGSY